MNTSRASGFSHVDSGGDAADGFEELAGSSFEASGFVESALGVVLCKSVLWNLLQNLQCDNWQRPGCVRRQFLHSLDFFTKSHLRGTDNFRNSGHLYRKWFPPLHNVQLEGVLV